MITISLLRSWWCSAFTGYGSINDNLTGDWCANRIKSLKGLDSLLSIVQMPGGIPVATTAIGKSGAKNAGILAARILSISHKSVLEKLENYEKHSLRK